MGLGALHRRRQPELRSHAGETPPLQLSLTVADLFCFNFRRPTMDRSATAPALRSQAAR